jgi:serine/threonine-protein kinase
MIAVVRAKSRKAPSSQEISFMRDLIGQTVGRYEVRSLIGKGGMGEVYRAWDTRLNREVALKRLSPAVQSDPAYRKRFLKEAERAAALNHQNIAALHDVLEDHDEVFLVMELVEGDSLEVLLEQPLSIAEFVDIAMQITSGLCAAHAERIVHRDVKPSNIRVSASRNVKILDFGIARMLPGSPEDARTATEDSTSKGSIIGTPAYMAPELLMGSGADQRSDLFSLGIVFYQALTGRHPYAADTFAGMINRLFNESPAPVSRLNSNVPDDLERMVDKLLAKDPNERYATAADLMADLISIKRRISPGPAPHPQPTRRPLPIGRWLGYAAGVVLAVVIVLAAYSPTRRGIVRWLGLAPLPEIRNLAVLGFAVTGDETDSDELAFARGLAVSLAEELTHLTRDHENLTVADPLDVSGYGVDSAQKAAEEVGANLVLGAVVEARGDAKRLSLRLEDALGRLRRGSIALADNDPFLTEQRLLDMVIDLLGLEWTESERRELTQADTRFAAAHEFLLRGQGYLWDYLDAQSLRAAISEFDGALRLDNEYAPAQAGIGMAHWRLYVIDGDREHLDIGLQACEDALQMDERLLVANLCLANVHASMEHQELAASYFERAVNQEPTSQPAYRGLADAYAALGRFEDAETVLRHAIERQPNSWPAYYQLGYLYSSHMARHAEAAEMFAAAIELAPELYPAYTALGAAYEQSGRNEAAIEALETSLAIHERQMYAHNNLATLYFFERRWPDASEHFLRAIQLGYEKASVWGNLGDARYWAPGERGEAAGCYEKALELAQQEQKSAVLLARMATWSAMLGESDDALADIERALEREPQNPAVLIKAAQVHDQLDDPEQAIEFVEMAIDAGYDLDRLLTDPTFEALKNHPLFERVLSGR